MLSGAVQTALYVLAAAAVLAAARCVGRFIPARFFAVFVALPVLFLLPGFVAEKTILPVDHAMAFPPWKTGETPLPRNPNLNDVMTQFVPWAKAARMAWKEGDLPLRDRWNGCGTPLAANGTSAAFSPLTILMMALPLARAFTLAAAVKLLLALSGTWLWLTELEISAAAGTLGAVAFGFSLTMTPWLLFPQTAVIALWPWALFAIERLRRKDSARRALALLTAVFAVWPLCGHLESVASGAAFAAVWLLARWAARDLPDAPPLAGRIALAAGAAAGLSAFALLPQIAAIGSSNRMALVTRPFWSGQLSATPHGPLWPGGLLLPLLPRLYGDAVTTPMKAGSTGPFPEMALGAIGLAAWAAALLILRPGSPRRRTALALLLPLAAGLGAAVGQWPFIEIAAALPGLKWMFPLRFFSWVALAGAALAAFEIDRLARDWKSDRAARALPLLLSVLCAGELFWQARRLYAFGSPGDLFPDRPLLAFLRAQPGPFRVVGEDDALFPNTNVFAGLEDVRTHDPIERRDYVLFLHASCGYDPADYFKRIGDLNCRQLDILNVKYLIAKPGRSAPGPKWKAVYSDPDTAAFENTSVLPRVRGDRVAVSGYRETTNTAGFRAQVAAGGDALVTTSLAQDGGWSARNGAGRPIPTGRAPDGPFLTLTLPPGDQEVRLLYRPPGWREGLLISLASLALLAALGLRRPKARPRASHGAS
jgi:hypothetical protein